MGDAIYPKSTYLISIPAPITSTGNKTTSRYEDGIPPDTGGVDVAMATAGDETWGLLFAVFVILLGKGLCVIFV